MDLGSVALLPFLIPLAVILLFVALQMLLLVVGGVSLFDFEAEVDVDTDVDVDADLDVDQDVDGGGGGHHFSLAQLLAPIGLGRVPLSVIFQAFGLTWGVSGVLLTYALTLYLGGPETWFLAITIPVSLVAAWNGTKVLVRMVAPLFRDSGTAESVEDLVGRVGRVTSLRVDREYGEVCVEVNNAPNYVFVRTRGEVIERGNHVVVVEYDVDAHRVIVAQFEQEVISTSEGVVV